jgi:acetyltransferase-like isoleucine patch superfamily enzyme
MAFDPATLSKPQLHKALAKARRHPHGDIHKGKLIISSEAFESSGRETNVCISPFSIIDCTGSIRVGPWCLIGARSRIYTHEHILMGKKPLMEVQEEHGVLWQDKYIGSDVWINDGAVVLYQVTHIPDGVYLGAGSVLTRNPGPYEIWAGIPARKIGTRQEATTTDIVELMGKECYTLPEFNSEQFQY